MSRCGRLLKKLLKPGAGKEQGQVMISALIALVVGGLVIAPTLSHMSTASTSTVVQKKVTRELYAVDAAMEHGMWKIKNNSVNSGVPEQITVDGIPVSCTVTKLTQPMEYGPIVSGDGTHISWLHVCSQCELQPDGSYKFIIHVRNDTGIPGTNMFLAEFGAGLPANFTYTGPCWGQTDQSPIIDGTRVKWQYSGAAKPKLSGGQEIYEYFYISGPGSPEEYYSWVQAEREDVGLVSTCEGFTVLAQAGVTRIEAKVIKNQGVVRPIYWKIN